MSNRTRDASFSHRVNQANGTTYTIDASNPTEGYTMTVTWPNGTVERVVPSPPIRSIVKCRVYIRAFVLDVISEGSLP